MAFLATHRCHGSQLSSPAFGVLTLNSGTAYRAVLPGSEFAPFSLLLPGGKLRSLSTIRLHLPSWLSLRPITAFGNLFRINTNGAKRMNDHVFHLCLSTWNHMALTPFRSFGRAWNTSVFEFRQPVCSLTRFHFICRCSDHFWHKKTHPTFSL